MFFLRPVQTPAVLHRHLDNTAEESRPTFCPALFVVSGAEYRANLRNTSNPIGLAFGSLSSQHLKLQMYSNKNQRKLLSK